MDPHPARWRVGGRYDRTAGMRRNVEMALVAEGLVAIPGAGPGTRHMIREARKRGLRTFVYEIPELLAG